MKVIKTLGYEGEYYFLFAHQLSQSVIINVTNGNLFFFMGFFLRQTYHSLFCCIFLIEFKFNQGA